MTREAVAQFHAHAFRPENAVLVVGGDCSAGDALAYAQDAFGDWHVHETLLTIPSGCAPLPAPRNVAIDKPDAGRTAIALAGPSIARDAPDFETAVVATAILSGYSGRLNQEVRVKRGLSYGAGAQISARRMGGFFIASTLVDHAKVAEGVRVVLDTIAGFARDGAGEQEVETRRTVVLGGYTRSLESVDGLVGALAELAISGLPLDLERHVTRVTAVDTARIAAFAATHLASGLSLVLAGDAGTFGDSVRAEVPLAVIPFAQLDLGAASLTG